MACVIIIRNHTNEDIDIVKSSINSITIGAYQEAVISFSMRSFCHGHSQIGSFIIQGMKPMYRIQSWGQLKVEHCRGNKDIGIFVVSQKK